MFRSVFRLLSVALVLNAVYSPVYAEEIQLFDMEAIRDASTLDVEVLEDWHPVGGEFPSRQKLVTIKVGEIWPGQEYRMPVRLIVPAKEKAKGFHLTGGNSPDRIKEDVRVSGISGLLLERGIGQVQTIVQVLGLSGLKELGLESEKRFAESLNPRDKIQYWAWPATMMRAITMAHSEKDHFEPGKVAMSGGSKNGATPSMAILHDDRMTAVHATVSPIWDSPLRLCDLEAWDALESKWGPVRHTFLGGHFGPNFNRQALKVGRSWEELQQFAANVSDGVFISRNLEALRQRGVDMLFHPGTHDFVAYDLAWGGAHHPDIPVFLAANTGHGIQPPHPENYPGQANRDVFLLEHFFEEVEPLLTAPTIETEIKGSMLEVSVTFPANSGEESGRLWWMFDRPMDGSPGYLEKRFPDENWTEMEKDPATGSWRAVIPLDDSAATVDFFSTHRKTIRYRDRDYNNSLSSPYARVNYGKSTGLGE